MPNLFKRITKAIQKAARDTNAAIDGATRALDAAASEAAGLPEGVKFGHAFKPGSSGHKAAMNHLKGDEASEEAVPAPAQAEGGSAVELELKEALALSQALADTAISKEAVAVAVAAPAPELAEVGSALDPELKEALALSQALADTAISKEAVAVAVAAPAPEPAEVTSQEDLTHDPLPVEAPALTPAPAPEFTAEQAALLGHVGGYL